jgi:disulfide bond formation protein DsbB
MIERIKTDQFVALFLSRLQLLTHNRLLMKPRVMLLAVFTAVVGLVIAPGHLDPLLGPVAVLAGAGAAGVLNMWYDADIDAVMTRTASVQSRAARSRARNCRPPNRSPGAMIHGHHSLVAWASDRPAGDRGGGLALGIIPSRHGFAT